jgi:hypothetical protein
MSLRVLSLRAPVMIAFMLLVVPRASAEPIQWSYQGQVVTTGPSDTSQNGNGPPNPHILISEVVFPGGITRIPGEQVQFADVSGSGSGSASMTAFQMRASTFFLDSPFSKNIHTFTLGFGLLDKASGKAGTVSFTGYLDGIMSGSKQSNSYYVDLQVGFTGKTQQSLVLGNHLYQLSIAPYQFQTGRSMSGGGPFPFVSAYQGVPVRVQVSDVPEPSTLALAALGLTGLGVRAWRRRRARRSAPPADEDSFSTSSSFLSQVA